MGAIAPRPPSPFLMILITQWYMFFTLAYINLEFSFDTNSGAVATGKNAHLHVCNNDKVCEMKLAVLLCVAPSNKKLESAIVLLLILEQGWLHTARSKINKEQVASFRWRGQGYPHFKKKENKELVPCLAFIIIFLISVGCPFCTFATMRTSFFFQER